MTKPMIKLPSMIEDELRAELADKDAKLADRDAKLADKEAQLADKDAEIRRLQQLVAQLSSASKSLA